MRSHKFARHSCGMNADHKREHQRPEGKLIERAMKGPPKISGRKLADMALLSEGRVRQIVNGYRTEGGMAIPIVAPADTIARLGAALHISAADFDEAGRPDVAEILRGEISSGVTEEGDLWLLDEDEYRLQLSEWLEKGNETVPPPRTALMLWEFDVLLEAVAKKHRDEMRFLENVNEILRSKGGDGHAEADAGGSASTGKGDYELIAHEEEHTIESEQGHDENP